MPHRSARIAQRCCGRLKPPTPSFPSDLEEALQSTGCHGGSALAGWIGCPVPSVSPRSTGCLRGAAASGWRGCPAPSVSPRSTGCRWSHSVCRLDRLPSSVGISPVNWLLLSHSHCRLDRFPSSVGISPVNWFTGEGQPCQAGQVPQFRRYLPGQLVYGEGQLCQAGQVPQFRRYLPGQLVTCEEQHGHPSLVVGDDTVPFAHRLVTQPVGVVRPIRPVRGVVKLDQHRPVLCRVLVLRHAVVATDEGHTLEPCLKCLIRWRAKSCVVIEGKRRQCG